LRFPASLRPRLLRRYSHHSPTWKEHLQHVRAVFQVLLDNSLALKQSKCSFGSREVAYLGHIIRDSGVAMDPSKIDAVLAWPTLTTVRALRGFLGLTGYYRKFIRDYGMVACPLTQLLKREAFSLSADAAAAFQALKHALTSGPTLQLPDFPAPFIVNCDASGSGFGAVQHQDKGPIAFYSRPVAPRHAKLAAYERKMIGLVKVVRHWRSYLWGRPFVVRTDHYSLKFLLDQRLSTIPQHTWVSKLFGYDFTVDFNPCKTNTVADALSRRDEEAGAMHSLSSPTFELYDEFRRKADTLPDVIKVKEQLAAGTAAWSIVDGLVLHEGRVFVSSSSVLWPGTRASRRCCSDSALPSTTRRPIAWCGISSKAALSVSKKD
jgi:hypothetical protein